MYEYQATVVRVVDGDTCDVLISLGFYVTVSQRVRLAGINTPEKIGATRTAGLAATAFTEDWVKQYGPKVTLQSQKPHADDKYGRFLARILSGTVCLNDDLLESGHAVPLTY